MLNEMFKFDDFADVRLVSDDGQEMKGHRVVLSACSSVLRDALRCTPKNGAKIHLKGIQQNEMKSILEFIYLGNTTVNPERIDNIIYASKILKIYEFSASVENLVKVQDNDSGILVQEKNLQENDNDILTEEHDNNSKTMVKQQHSKHDYIENFVEEKHVQNSDSKNYTISQHLENNGSYNNKDMWTCSQCDYYSARKIYLKRHIQVKHEGMKYDCKKCDNQYATIEKLKHHVKSVHEGLKFTCNECNFQFTRRDSLTYHTKSQHESMKLDCSKCNYQCVNKDSLKQHVKTYHPHH